MSKTQIQVVTRRGCSRHTFSDGVIGWSMTYEIMTQMPQNRSKICSAIQRAVQQVQIEEEEKEEEAKRIKQSQEKEVMFQTLHSLQQKVNDHLYDLDTPFEKRIRCVIDHLVEDINQLKYAIHGINRQIAKLG